MPSASTNKSGPAATDEGPRRAQRRTAIARSGDVGSAGLTTTVPPATELAAYVGGFTAAEGCLVCTEGGTRFSFAVGLSASDLVSCELLLAYLGVGASTGHLDGRPTRTMPLVSPSAPCLSWCTSLVPFMDEHLAPSYKRVQYEEWRAELLEYWEHRAKRVRPCTVEGCEAPRRAKGLCRSHYFAAYRR